MNHSKILYKLRHKLRLDLYALHVAARASATAPSYAGVMRIHVGGLTKN